MTMEIDRLRNVVEAVYSLFAWIVLGSNVAASCVSCPARESKGRNGACEITQWRSRFVLLLTAFALDTKTSEHLLLHKKQKKILTFSMVLST